MTQQPTAASGGALAAAGRPSGEPPFFLFPPLSTQEMSWTYGSNYGKDQCQYAGSSSLQQARAWSPVARAASGEGPRPQASEPKAL